MNIWQIIAKAVQNPGMKIRSKKWSNDNFIFYDDGSGGWVSHKGIEYIFPSYLSLHEWEEYKEPEEMVKLYKVAYIFSGSWYESEEYWKDIDSFETKTPGFGSKKAFIIESSMIEVPKSSLNGDNNE